jgi:alpha,alpha-trehalose phosphorylase
MIRVPTFDRHPTVRAGLDTQGASSGCAPDVGVRRRRQARSMNSLPYDAVLFDLDGVLTPTAALHARCWKHTFDVFLDDWGRSTGTRPEPFDAERDYLAHVDGKLRDDGVRDFLRARGIAAPAAGAETLVGAWSVQEIGMRKQALVERALSAGCIEAYPGSVRWVRDLRDAGIRTAVVSSSTNATAVLRAAGIRAYFDAIVDGRDVEQLGLSGKPAPDGFLEAARRLAVAPARAIVVEDALAGVAAGRAGDFGLVIGVARSAAAAELRCAGADVVVADLAEMLP